MLFLTYYAQNYVGIIGASLPPNQVSSSDAQARHSKAVNKVTYEDTILSE